MLALRTVYCPVDFSAATPRQVEVAADLCLAFGARLVLHHNRHSLGTVASVGWMWQAQHPLEDAERAEARLRECRAHVPPGILVEPLLTEGPVSRAVRVVSEAVGAELVVLTVHAPGQADDLSIAERLLDEGQRSLLVLHDPAVEPRTPLFASACGPQPLVIATDLAAESQAALDLGFDLARLLLMHVHIVHFLPGGRAWVPGGASEEDIRRRIWHTVPEDVAYRTAVHIERSDPAAGIVRTADRLGAACIVMGEHTRRPLRRWLTRNTARAVLHEARSPVWYVPQNGGGLR